MTLPMQPVVRIKQFRFKLHIGRPTICLPSSSVVPRKFLTSRSAPRQAIPSRKQVTVVGDDGRVQWQDLSRREKVARTTQQTFNFGLVLSGVFLTVRSVFQ